MYRPDKKTSIPPTNNNCFFFKPCPNPKYSVQNAVVGTRVLVESRALLIADTQVSQPSKSDGSTEGSPHKKVIIPPSMCCNPRFCLSMLILGSLFCHFLFCRKWTSNFITIRQITPFLRQMVAVFLVVVSCCGILGLNRAQLSASPRKLSWRAPLFWTHCLKGFFRYGF